MAQMSPLEMVIWTVKQWNLTNKPGDLTMKQSELSKKTCGFSHQTPELTIKNGDLSHLS